MAGKGNSRARGGGQAGRGEPPPPPKPRRKRAWPYVFFLLVAWGTIFGAVFFSRFVSNLPDVNTLLAHEPSKDITLLDDKGRMIARRGLTQGSMIPVEQLPRYV